MNFLKMHGTGNDFVVLDLLRHPLPADFDFARAAQTLCERHFSIGGDGLLTLEKPAPEYSDCAARMRMWNPDGSEDMCGNGLRCIAFLARLRHLQSDEFFVQTLAGAREVAVKNADDIQVEMGAPRFDAASIPMRLPAEYSELANIEYALPLGNETVKNVTTLSTGSAHSVVFVEELPDEKTFQTLSPQIEHHAWFPERTSIMWARPRGENRFQLRIWERGVGETLACGTGACATAAAAVKTRRAPMNTDIEIESKGGTLRIRWDETRGLLMSGAARIVCEGKTTF